MNILFLLLLAVICDLTENVLAERCRVFTYWENILEARQGTGRQKAILFDHVMMIKLWARNWFSNGWHPTVLGLEDAQRNPRYKSFRNHIHQLPTVNDRRYEIACYTRWLAFQEAGGGVFSDYDILNFHASAIPFCAGPCGKGKLVSYPAFLPMLIFGNATEVNQLINILDTYQWQDDDRYDEKPHTSDMIIARKLQTLLFPSLVPNPKDVAHFATYFHIKMLSLLPKKPRNLPKVEWARQNLINNLLWTREIFILANDLESLSLLPAIRSLLSSFVDCKEPTSENLPLMIESLRPDEDTAKCRVQIVSELPDCSSSRQGSIIIAILEDPVVRIQREHSSFNRARRGNKPLSISQYITTHSGSLDHKYRSIIDAIKNDTPKLVVGFLTDLPSTKLLLEYELGIMLPSIVVPYDPPKDAINGDERRVVETAVHQDLQKYHQIYKIFAEKADEVTNLERSIVKLE